MPFYRHGLRNGWYTAKYESPLSLPICLHEMGPIYQYTLGKYFLAATSNPFQNCFRPPPFTCSATSLFALSSLHNMLHVGCVPWLLFSLLSIESTTQFQPCYLWQKLSVPPLYSLDISECHEDSLTCGCLLTANIATLCLNSFSGCRNTPCLLSW